MKTRKLIVVCVLALLVASVAAMAAGGDWMGTSAQGTFWTNSVATSGSNLSTANWWNTTAGNWVGGGNSSDAPQVIVVDAYVEMYCQRQQQTQATFHWGQPPFTAQTANVTGTLVENHPCWIGVAKTGANAWVDGDGVVGGQASVLKFDLSNSYAEQHGGTALGNDGNNAYATNDTTKDIPITWALNVAGTTRAMKWNTGLQQQYPGWYSDGRLPVGNIPYQIQITATPDPYQADGHYSLDPDVVVLPDM